MVTLDMVAGDMKEVDERRQKETLVKEKKQKCRKNKDHGGSEEQPTSVDNKSFKKAKKKKGETTEEGSQNREKKTMKKNKKKKKELEENGSLDVYPFIQEEPSSKKQKKLKKTNDKSVQYKAAGCSKTDKEKAVLATKRIQSKKVKVQIQSEVINVDESEEDDEVVMVKTTKKKNKTGPKTSVTKTIAREEESQGVHQKAKKRKAHLEMGEDTLETVKKKKKKGKQEETKPTKRKKASSSVVVVEEDSPKPKKKAIKGGERQVSPKVEGAQEVGIVDDKEQKRKKKENAKVDKQTAVKDMAQNTETFVFVASDSKGKGKRAMMGASEEIKRKTKKEEVEVSVDKKKRKKKIKLEEDAPAIEQATEVAPKDVVFLSEKSGNRDEVNINQERRLALQMDIDKESRPQTTAKPLGFGQWSTAQFDSTDKQQKFLRLMGGFKKESKTSSPSGPSTMRPNMALAQDKQQDLQQALLGEFERAQSRRGNFSARGAGLGFSAPPSKFSIDANASRSVRFDD